ADEVIWFKTRVGLASATQPCEIVYTKRGNEPTWCILASFKTGTEMTVKTLYGRSVSVPAPAFCLACFSDGPRVSESIAECMSKIEVAIRTQADICDLSEAGDAAAWGKEWKQVPWSREGNGGNL
ncbi:MAG TPA: hypothetical protein VHE81_16210, partial [Lacipirellulaceae bacterium]|nr:hypothetical protein [Lacipirellulaceae bacterium]